MLEGGAVVEVPLGSYIECSTIADGACHFKPCAAGRYGHDPPQNLHARNALQVGQASAVHQMLLLCQRKIRQ